MPRKRLSNQDTLMLRVEDPTHPNVGMGVMVLGAPVDFDRLKLAIEARFLCFDRFRQRLVQPLLPWMPLCWEDDPGFDLGYHLQQVTLSPPGDHAALQELVSLLASIPLDRDRPLWQMHLVPQYGRGSALICQVHHSLADGVALMHVLLSLADSDAQAPSPSIDPRRPPTSSCRRTAARLARQATGTLGHLPRPAELGRLGRNVGSAAKSLLLARPDSATPLRGQAGDIKVAAWSGPIPLDDVKAIGRRLGGTVNDVLLTALTGALARYLADRGQLLDDICVHALVPVSLRAEGTEAELGNRIGVVFVPLPIGISDPGARLRELRRQMEKQKNSLQAPLVLAGMKVFGAAPSALVKPAVGYICRQVTAAVTNLRGPAQPIYLAGSPLEEFMFWIPRYGGIGVAISIVSYAGQVRVGAMSDKDIVSDPETILARFEDEFDALLTVANHDEIPSLDELSARVDQALAALDALRASRPRASGK